MRHQSQVAFGSRELFPSTVKVSDDDHLILGGCDTVDLAKEYGTPLYIFDEETLRSTCRKFVDQFNSVYTNTKVLYASKAFLNPALARLISEEGLGIDVVSGGELAVAEAVGFPFRDVYFHGNNKGADELVLALDYGVGRVVVDSFYEMELLNTLAAGRGITQDVMLRLSPSVDPHTHSKTTTGVLDSKFGFSIDTGDAERAILATLSESNLELVGIHFHLGSPIFELEPYAIAIDAVLSFLEPFRANGLELREFSPGGGFAIGYLHDQLPPPIASYADVIGSAFSRRASDLGFGNPTLVIEPGRAIVGRAGVALYTVGAIKEIPGVRKYVSLDGGMGDNIRPALYESEYEAVVGNRMSDRPEETVTLAGKYCESGDVLIRDTLLPKLEAGDLIAIPGSGAYAPSMASNYNWNPRPAIVIVKEGKARLIRRRETYSDMMLCDIM